MVVKFKRMTKAENLKMPEIKTKGAAAYDLYFPYQTQILHKGETKVFKLGWAVEVPEGYYLEIRGRSGLSSKGILSATGTVDSDYRGEIGAILTNVSENDFFIHEDDRICQAMIKKVIETECIECEHLSDTERGSGGFGSTGI